MLLVSALIPVGCVLRADRVAKKRRITVGGIEGASRVAKERERSIGCVVAARGVAEKRHSPKRRIVVCGVEKERPRAGSGVEAARRVAKERIPTNCRVGNASGKTLKGLGSFCSSEVGIASVRCRTDRMRSRQKRKAGEHERNEKESKPQRRRGDGCFQV